MSSVNVDTFYPILYCGICKHYVISRQLLLFIKYFFTMTTLEYLADTYKFQSEAKVLEIKTTEKGLAVILDKTIFYPQGGGQPADHGKIVSDKAIFVVSDVRIDESGAVHHFGEFKNGNFDAGDLVKLNVDADRRRLNARLHSAGHVIDIAASKVGFGLKAIKGYHFTDGPYVEYEGTIENPENYISAIENAANSLVKENLALEVKEFSPEEAKNQGIHAPEGKSARTINLLGYKNVGCGGTHVKNASEIGKINIRKISSKKGNTKIAYSLD